MLLFLFCTGVKAPAYYHYSWEVKDSPSGNDYRQQETRDGHLTTGLYQVLLPGGRHQVSVPSPSRLKLNHPILFYSKMRVHGSAPKSCLAVSVQAARLGISFLSLSSIADERHTNFFFIEKEMTIEMLRILTFKPHTSQQASSQFRETSLVIATRNGIGSTHFLPHSFFRLSQSTNTKRKKPISLLL